MKRTAELALIRSVPDLTLGTLPPSRLKGLFERLQKHVDKDLRRRPRITEDELAVLRVKLDEFSQATGWNRNPKHIGTLLSFCLEIIERSEFKFNQGITEVINQIIAHLEDGKDFHYPSCWGGEVAYNKWEDIWK